MNKMKDARLTAWNSGIDDGPPPGKGKAASAKRGSSELVVRQQSNTPNSADLQALADKIKTERDAFERKSIESAQHLIRLGELLDEARRKISHGGWREWIESNCQISKSTVHNYISIAAAVRDGRLDCPTVGQLGVKAALALIAKPKSEPKPIVTDAKPAETTSDQPVTTAALQRVKPVFDVPVVNTSELRRQAKDARAESDRCRARSDAFNTIGRVSTEELFAPECELLTQLEFVIGRYLVGEPSDGWISAAKVLNRLYDKVTSREITAETHRDRWPGYVDGQEQQHAIEGAVTPPAGGAI